jgi:hypothetical protein
MRTANFKSVSEYLPSTVKQAIGQPPICDMIKVTGKASIVLYIQFELIQLSQLISVNGNLTNAQIEFIAVQLVDYFPGESIADFKICFQRGAIGQYGEIFRMDGIVIRKWMEQYLEEKYTIVEEELKKSPDSMYKQSEVKTHDERHSDWLDKWQKEVGGVGQKVPGISDQDTRKYGQEKPVRNTITSGYKYFPVGDVQVYAITEEHAKELYALMQKNKLI